MINVEIIKGPNENNISAIKRFTRATTENGVIKRKRDLRYASRNRSSYVQKKGALERLARQKDYEEKVKLGKINPRVRK